MMFTVIFRETLEVSRATDLGDIILALLLKQFQNLRLFRKMVGCGSAICGGDSESTSALFPLLWLSTIFSALPVCSFSLFSSGIFWGGTLERGE